MQAMKIHSEGDPVYVKHDGDWIGPYYIDEVLKRGLYKLRKTEDKGEKVLPEEFRERSLRKYLRKKQRKTSMVT